MTRHHLRTLRRWREAKRISRKKLAEIISGDSTPPLHEITLLKREKGDFSVSDEELAKWLKALGDKTLEELNTEAAKLKPLKLSIAPYPDFIFFSLAAGEAGDAPCKGLPEWETLLEPEILRNEYHEIPAKVANGTIHAALYGEDAFKRDVEETKLQRNIVECGPALLFCGYSILSTNHAKLTSFAEAFRKTSQRSIRQRLEQALVKVFCEAGKQDADFLVPGETTMYHLAVELLALAEEVCPDEDLEAIKKLSHNFKSFTLPEATKDKDKDTRTWLEFCDRLKAGEPAKPALFFGGLSHRLLAEDAGASTLVSKDDLAKIAEDRKSMESEMSGKNVLIVNKDALETMEDELSSFIHNWDLLIKVMRAGGQPADDISRLVQKKLSTFSDPNATLDPRASSIKHFARASRQGMLQFFPIEAKALQPAPPNE